MRFEVVESSGEWIVQSDGVELARYGEQDAALNDIAERLRGVASAGRSVSLSVRYQSRDWRADDPQGAKANG
jgi:hypothetical protein